jgi:integrase
LDEQAKENGTIAPSVPPITSRGFQRTFATRRVRTGDLRSTQELLGHRTSQITQEIYAEPELDAMRDTVRAIQARVGSRGLFNKSGQRNQERVAEL